MMGRREFRSTVRNHFSRQLTPDEKEFIDASWRDRSAVSTVVAHIARGDFTLPAKMIHPVDTARSADRTEADRARREREAAERKADRNRRWAEAVKACMEMDYDDPIWYDDRLAAVFDAIAGEAAGGEEVGK